MMDDGRFQKGLAIRREVVGERRVRESLAGTDAFWLPLQEMTTSFAWGDVWGRTYLDRRSRSVMTLGMLIALGRWAELEVHVIGAMNNGMTEIEIREMVIQSAVYCGFPAALEASRAARAAVRRYQSGEVEACDPSADHFFWGEGSTA